MIWALCGTSALASLFLFLFVRSAINNDKLQNQIMELTKNVETAKKQLEIAALSVATPDELAERMRKGTL